VECVGQEMTEKLWFFMTVGRMKSIGVLYLMNLMFDHFFYNTDSMVKNMIGLTEKIRLK
jgi:hypothetical protein